MRCQDCRSRHGAHGTAGHGAGALGAVACRQGQLVGLLRFGFTVTDSLADRISFKECPPRIPLSVLSTQAMARDNLSIIGSRTVAPYAQLVADEIVKQDFAKDEMVASNTSQAFEHFRRGVGALCGGGIAPDQGR
jgi:ABC-type phosphate transport system substrate-binding protein